MKDDMQFKYEAGFNGKPDLMRSRAQNIMNAEMKKADVTKLSPHSFSSGEHTKMRNYKKGGKVKAAEGGTIPVKSPFMPSMSPAMKKGGKVHKEMTTSGKMEKPAALFEKKESKHLPMKKGGMAKVDAKRARKETRGMPKECVEGKMTRVKLAIGGSGKIRHKEMTPAGKQLNAKGKPTSKRCMG